MEIRRPNARCGLFGLAIVCSIGDVAGAGCLERDGSRPSEE